MREGGKGIHDGYRDNQGRREGWILGRVYEEQWKKCWDSIDTRMYKDRNILGYRGIGVGWVLNLLYIEREVYL